MTSRATFYLKPETDFAGFNTVDLRLCRPTYKIASWSPKRRIDYIMSLEKSNLAKTHIEQSVESNIFKKCKAIASLPILSLYFRFFLKKRFLRKPSKPGHRNVVLITSTNQVELSKLNFNFDDIRTYFLQVLRGVDK